MTRTIRWKITARLVAWLILATTSTLWAQGGDPNYKPRRINKMIELLEDGQTVFDVNVSGAGYEEGKKLAQHHADLIQYEMEHGPVDFLRLREFMQGLVDGGPTKSGHRTPTVIVTTPFIGIDAVSVRANFWVVEQILSSGVHGLMLIHARNAEVVREFVRCARYQFSRPGLKDQEIAEGLRGNGGQAFPARIWGVSTIEYTEKADPWPMNPNGELILSLKMEDKHVLPNIDEITKVQGIAWGEWGPTDQSMSIKGLDYLKQIHGRSGTVGRAGAVSASTMGLPPTGDPELEAARTRIMKAMMANNIAPLHSSTDDNVIDLIKAGVRVTHAGNNTVRTNKAREFQKRKMPY
ncbi:MAG: hypothetical protein AB7O65_08405 [Candidatus Korobacteraceae bacterium]